MACVACEFFSTHTSQCQARFCWWKVSFKGKVMLVKVFWKFIHIRNHLILLVSTNDERKREGEREGSIESFWYIKMCISLHYRSKTIKLRYLENLYFSSRNFTHSNNHAQAYMCVWNSTKASNLDILDCLWKVVCLSIYGLTFASQNSFVLICNGNNFNKSHVRAINSAKLKISMQTYSSNSGLSHGCKKNQYAILVKMYYLVYD